MIAQNFIGDAYSDTMKQRVIEYIKNEFGGKIDLLVYSLAAPKRNDPRSEKVWRSVLKPIDQSMTGENIDLEHERLFTETIAPATPEEIQGTAKVMGGEDWECGSKR